MAQTDIFSRNFPHLLQLLHPLRNLPFGFVILNQFTFPFFHYRGRRGGGVGGGGGGGGEEREGGG